jgi:hypothetical protein
MAPWGPANPSWLWLGIDGFGLVLIEIFLFWTISIWAGCRVLLKEILGLQA